jgi:hypothetical protein
MGSVGAKSVVLTTAIANRSAIANNYFIPHNAELITHNFFKRSI